MASKPHQEPIPQLAQQNANEVNSPIPERFKFSETSAVQKEPPPSTRQKYAAMPRRTFTRDAVLRQYFGIDSSCDDNLGDGRQTRQMRRSRDPIEAGSKRRLSVPMDAGDTQHESGLPRGILNDMQKVKKQTAAIKERHDTQMSEDWRSILWQRFVSQERSISSPKQYFTPRN
jgi:hypothetical protein